MHVRFSHTLSSGVCNYKAEQRWKCRYNRKEMGVLAAEGGVLFHRVLCTQSMGGGWEYEGAVGKTGSQFIQP